jgi:formate hydrogenlyase subunit 3/multisubunit Na+/H+ antiporter MnhD subunit
MPVALLLGFAAALLGLGMLAPAVARRPLGRPLVYGASCGLALALAGTALVQLLSAGAASTTILPLALPWIGAHFRIDGLSALFLAVLGVGAAAASLYAVGYGRHEAAPERVLPFFPAFLGTMALVLLADDAFTFLVSWESMSLASWALVMAHHRDAENARAGFLYIVMAGFGTLALLLAFGLLAGSGGSYAFDDIRAAPATGLHAALVLGLVLLGAGSKAGLVPLHVWLPEAHPAAPSHVSALMSGVMTKVAVYGFIRIVFDLLGPVAWWWGLVVLLVGGATAVVGILSSLMETDIKRVLACSTIENIGFIFVGLGLALAFEANGLPLAAALAATAALFHVVNHMLFKSLLFFGAGAVLTATGRRDLAFLGGLIGRMPATAAFMLAGCVAISALPPLNGFVSEWLTLQAILLSPELPQWGLKLAVPAVGALLALSAALVAASFVRLFGIGFLGRTRSPEAAAAREVDRWSLGAMGGLAGLCVLAGLLPGVVIDGLSGTVGTIVGGRMPGQWTHSWIEIVPLAEARSSYSGLLVFVFITISAGAASFAIHRLASRALRRAPAWDCGFPDPSPATQYGPDSFAQPIRRVFGTVVFRARERIVMPPPGATAAARLTVERRDLVWDLLYAPIVGTVSFLADRMNRLQFLTIRRYLGMVFLTLIALLLVQAIWP